MKIEIIIVLAILVLGCSQTINSNDKKVASNAIESPRASESKPKVSFTFDDGITRDIAMYPFEEWNRMILTALKEAGVTATFFVTGSNKLDTKGRYLLKSWSNEGHAIANHTYTHPNFNSETMTVEDFEEELLKTDTVISEYDNYVKLFRFPYLKEGKTEEKIAGYRNVLSKHGYKNGHVTIDASDWYINGELIKFIKKEGIDNPKIDQYKAYYLQHILERASFYDSLSYQLTNRHINHTLLLHHNLTSALFLDDLIAYFQNEGWEVISTDEAFQDAFFAETPNTVPAGESLVWSVAKETGAYEHLLRYPAEDSRYEKPRMEKLGL